MVALPFGEGEMPTVFEVVVGVSVRAKMFQKLTLCMALIGLMGTESLFAKGLSVFVERACTFEVPVSAGVVRCGIVEVPASRTVADSGTILLSVAILKARDAASGHLPLVYLHGGPGSSAIRSASKFFNSTMRQDRDLILFDQRGSQFSGRFCADVSADMFTLMLRDLSPDEQAQKFAELLASCKQNIAAQGIDLINYNQMTNST